MKYLLQYLNDIWTGQNTALPVVFFIGLITNLVAWWITKEKAKKIRVYRITYDDHIKIAIQNYGNRYIDNMSFVGNLGCIQLGNTSEIKVLTKDSSLIKLNKRKDQIQIMYLHAKSSVILRIEPITNIQIEAWQKDFKTKIEITDLNAGRSWIIYFIIESTKRILTLLSFPILFLGILLFMELMSVDRFYSIVNIGRIIFTMFAYLMIYFRLRLKPKRIYQIRKLFSKE